MSSSFAGSGVAATLDGTKRSCAGPTCARPIAGNQVVAGASPSSNATLRGPVRRSSSAAMEVGQLATAISRCASVMLTCASFSASTKVAVLSFGPTGGAVSKAPGEPGGGVPGAGFSAVCANALPATMAPSRPSGAWVRKSRRVFMVLPDTPRSGSALLSNPARMRPAPHPGHSGRAGMAAHCLAGRLDLDDVQGVADLDAEVPIPVALEGALHQHP